MGELLGEGSGVSELLLVNLGYVVGWVYVWEGFVLNCVKFEFMCYDDGFFDINDWYEFGWVGVVFGNEFVV